MSSGVGRAKAFLKTQVQRTGISVAKRSSYEDLRRRASRDARYPTAMAQIEGVWRERLMPGLPARERRVALLSELLGTEPAEAMHLVYWLHEVGPVEGVLCELGCASGATTALLANEVADTDRELWIFDSFEGLSRPTAEDTLIDDIFSKGTMEAYEGTMAYPETEVRHRLRSIAFPDDRVHIVPGFLPGSLETPGLPEAVAFAYVDFDLYAPIEAGLAWLHDRMSPGGIIVVDDYGWFSSGAQTAVDEFTSLHADDYEVRHVEAWVGHFIGLVRR